MRHFDNNEFKCKCGCGANGMRPDFLAKLDNAREIAGVPFAITSGYRCDAHNAAEGGKPKSSHRKGVAADISANGSRRRFRILYGLIKAGIHRIGIGKDFIHADDDKTLDPEVVWLY